MSDLTLADLPLLMLVCSALGLGMLGYVYPDLTVRSVVWWPVLLVALLLLIAAFVVGSSLVLPLVVFVVSLLAAAGAVALTLLAVQFSREDVA